MSVPFILNLPSFTSRQWRAGADAGDAARMLNVRKDDHAESLGIAHRGIFQSNVVLQWLLLACPYDFQ